MSTISPSLQIGGVNGWKGKEGAVLGWQQTSGGLFKPAKTDFARLSGQGFVDSSGVPQWEFKESKPAFTWINGKQYFSQEKASTNLFLNSETLSTQSVTVANATEYTVSFYGTGSITFSGGHTGTLNGTGASDKVEVTFTTSSTSVTCTVSGTVQYANFELGAEATSWIRTEGSAVTRAAGSSEALNLANFLGAEGGLVVRLVTPVDSGSIALSDGTTDNRAYFTYDSGTSKWSFIVVVGGVTQCSIAETGTSAAGDLITLGARFEANDFVFYKEGTQEGTDSSGSVFGSSDLTQLSLDNGAASIVLYTSIEYVKAFEQGPTNTQLATETA